MSTAQKVLVTGRATNGLASYFKKLEAMQSKHSFSVVLALDLFSGLEDDSIELAQLMAGQIAVPEVQIYVSVGQGDIPRKVQLKVDNGEEVCENVTVLAKTAMLTLASGLRIGTFGGSFDPVSFNSDPATDHDQPQYITQDDLSTFRSLLTPPPSSGALPPKPIPSPDVLLTHVAPASVALLSSKPFSASGNASAKELDEVLRLAKPKYHFIGGTSSFWEREPFEWSRSDGGGFCRTISLGEMGNPTKERWFYAFSIMPGAAPGPRPPNVTASPYNAVSAGGQARGMKRPAGELEANAEVNEYGVPNFIFGGGQNGDKGRKKGRSGPPDHYTCNICQQKGHWIQDCPEKEQRDAEREAARGPRGQSKKPISPDECWFCLSNPKVTKHLIASIGTETYLTLPKGQLCPTTSKDDATSTTSVPGGGHVLIIPIAHYPTLLSIPGDSAEPIISEVDSYKAALRKCYAEYECELVAFEVGRVGGKGGHAHVQICPVPRELAKKAESHFREEGSKVGLTFEEQDDKVAAHSSGGDETDQAGLGYFRVDLPDSRVLVHRMQPGQRFDLQFGRATLASLLGTPDRADWKACVRSDAEEKGDCQRFKAAFKKFDPSE